tara:strand:+ start:5011 stop:5184 length:174 start_codon:yes stop_codon:yes gene_type:complete
MEEPHIILNSIPGNLAVVKKEILGWDKSENQKSLTQYSESKGLSPTTLPLRSGVKIG